MPEAEEKVSQETKEAVTDPKQSVTDELANAMTAEETGKEAVVEEKPKTKEMTPEQLEEHKERSNLGRKMKKLEEDLARQTELLQNLLQSRSPQNQPGDDEVPEYIQTPADLERYNAHKAREEQKAKIKYESEYVRTLKGISDKDGEMGEEIMREVMKFDSPFNRIVHGFGGADARINYAEAKAAMLQSKIAAAKPKPNVKGEKSPVSTQLNVTTREESSRSAEPELDDFAKEFVQKTKMKDESVRAALK